jgi:DNA invertase Pin-like site-specific DNA recombinase
MTLPAIPAAQYLRMSTDHQQHSLGYQADAIARYAAEHGFEIVKIYSDAAKSGVRLKNRSALKQLLKDVVQGSAEFRSVLVYDVSRWGRFQDADEAAH